MDSINIKKILQNIHENPNVAYENTNILNDIVWYNKLRYEPLYEIYKIILDKNIPLLDKIIYYKDWESRETYLSNFKLIEKNLNQYSVNINDKINLYLNYWLLVLNDLKTR